MQEPFRVAVVGAGPSGLYTVASLLAAPQPVHVAVLDRLPAPYGLVRYGVAPDHVKMKSVIRVLQKPFAGDRVEFLGGVRIGADGLPLDALRRHVHAVVHASGCSVDRRLGVPGEDLAGSLGSGEFVRWYSGHPDQAELAPPLDRPGVAVVGAGNVALDIARMLAKTADELASTDIPDPVHDALVRSAVRDIHVLVRRGPQDVRFTPAELHQIGELANADVLLHDDGLLAREDDAAEHRVAQVMRTFRAWDAAPPTGRPRRIHLRFLRSPVRLVGGGGGVGGVVVERNAVAPDGRVRGTGETETLDVGLVVRAIGYDAEPTPGLPFDARTGTVPNEGGRVLDGSGRRVPGAYVAGWVKRGPSGVIGTNKADAAQTAAAVLADLPSLPEPAAPFGTLRSTLAEHGVRPVDWTAWLRLDAEEIRLGGAGVRGAARVKVSTLADMLTHAQGVVAP